MRHEILGQQLIHGAADGLGQVGGNLLQLAVGGGGGALGQQQGADEGCRHGLPADRKVVDGALGLRGIERLCRYRQFAHAVFFYSGIAHDAALLGLGAAWCRE